jgi:formate hydrogenlyase subunit 3/multisubunit Na+/H+ antiporter MnhD subunit
MYGAILFCSMTDFLSLMPWLMAFFFVAALSILGTAFWLWMIVDCLTRRFDDNIEKILWVVALIFGWFFAAIVYYFAVRKISPHGILTRDVDTKKDQHTTRPSPL